MNGNHRLALLVVAVLLLNLCLGCAPKQAARMSEMAQAPSAAPAPPAEADAVSGGAEAKRAGGDETSAAVTDRKIITTGTMTVQVKNLDAALTELQRLVKQHGGFIANKTVSSQENWRNAEVTIRVPADRYDSLHQGARALGEVEREEQQGEDVTKQWQDLEARIKIRKAEEQALVRLMDKQARLADLLEVEKRLWEVREQIETAEGELRYLRDKVTLATLTVSLNEEIPAGVGKVGPWNLTWHLKRAAMAFVSAIRAIIVAVIYIALPGAVVWVPLLLLILWIRRRLRARRAAREAAQ